MRMPFRALILSSTMLLFCATLTFGQGIVTGSISGTVEDSQGAVVPGASVQATQLETKRVFTTTSSNGGVVQLPSLPPGAYRVVVQATGFSNYNANDVHVEVGKDTTLGKITMSVGSVSESVEVTGQAPIVESTTDQLSQTFDTKEVASVPLGNTYDSFVLFTPGVVTAGSGGFSNNNGAELSINGQRARSNNYQLDGQNNNDNTIGGANFFFGNQDAIAELQIVTNFDAEYGRNLGGVVNYITKSGTNSFHGTGFEFWQGDHFDSLENQEKSVLFGFCPQGVVNPQTGPYVGCTQPVVPQYVQNQFGGTIGGPIKRNKLWFFGSANFQRNRSSGSPDSSSGALTPDSNGLQTLEADYPNSPAVQLLKAWAPITITSGSPKFIPSSITTVPITANQFGPASSVEVGTLQRFLSQPFNDYEATGRLDYQITQNDRLFGRYLFQKTIVTNEAFTGPAGAAQGQFVNVPGKTQQVGLDYTHTFSPNFLNQARFGYSRSTSEFDGGGFSNCVLANIGSCPPQIAFQDQTVLGVGQSVVFPQGRIINVYQAQDNASIVHGKHVMKFGGEYDRQRSPNYGLFGVNTQFTFQDLSGFVANTPIPATTSIAFGQPVLRFKENDFALYFQDDWRARDNLTLNLGLRWEFFQQAANLLHDESVAQQTGPNPLWDQSLPLSLTTVPKLPNHYRNFGPVVGFAWTPKMLPSVFGNNKTVVRGGFRIAYDFAYYNLATNVQGSAPFTNFATINAGLPTVATYDGSSIAAALFPLVSKGNPGVASELQFGSNFRNPYSEQWNLGIQRQLTSKAAFELRYVGNHDLANFQEINGNPDVLPLIANGFGRFVPSGITPCTNPNLPGGGFAGAGNPAATDQFGNPVGYANCNFSRVTEYANTGYSIYNGLQSQFRLQDWHGFTGEVSYTFSKTIDNASEAFSTFDGTFFAIAQNPFDVSKSERGVSNYDYPNVFSVLWVYDLPFQKAQKGVLGHILGGWEINGTYRYNSGEPWTVEQSIAQGLCDPTNFTNGGLDACRPFLGNSRAPLSSVGQCMDPTVPGCGLVSLNTGSPMAINQVRYIINDINSETFFGTPFSPLGRNTERGQPISTVNLAVFKNFKVTERVTFQFQAEAFNAFNHQWLATPIQNVNAASASFLGVTEFGSLKFNGNGGDVFAGNTTTDGITRRRLQFGGKIIF